MLIKCSTCLRLPSDVTERMKGRASERERERVGGDQRNGGREGQSVAAGGQSKTRQWEKRREETECGKHTGREISSHCQSKLVCCIFALQWTLQFGSESQFLATDTLCPFLLHKNKHSHTNVQQPDSTAQLMGKSSCCYARITVNIVCGEVLCLSTVVSLLCFLCM